MKLRAKLLFKIFFIFFRTFSHKVVQTLFFANKQGTQHYLVYIIVLKWLESQTIVMYLKLRVKLRF